jgi:hypothetical protein
MALLKVKRLNEWVNRKFPYAVMVNGKEQFQLTNGQENILTLNQPVTLQVKMRWCSSPELKIENGESIKEIIISANRWTGFYIPLISMVLLFVSSFQTLFLKSINTITLWLLGAMVIGLLALIFFARDKFLVVKVI